MIWLPESLQRIGQRIIMRPPSFRTHIAHRKRVHGSARVVDGRAIPLVPWETKSGARGVAEAVGVPVPRLFYGPSNLDGLNFDEMPERFVIKPDWGSTGNGVYALALSSEVGRRFDLLRGRWLTTNEIRDDVRRAVAGNGTMDSVLCEELVGDGAQLPKDWKFYCFHGEIGMIVQVSRGPSGPRFKYYSSNWSSLGNARVTKKKIDQSLAHPRMPEALSSAAQAISSSLPTPFVRVDLYQGAEGEAVFGELGLRPDGQHYYLAPIDRHLGRAWERAESRLLRSSTTIVP